MQFKQRMAQVTVTVLAGCGFQAALAQSAALEAIEEKERIARQSGVDAIQRDAARHFVVTAPGVVKDKRTGLEWMRCTLGQDWDEKSKTCKGKVKAFDQDGANAIANKINGVGGFAKRVDWRLPSVRELAGLRYCSKGFDSKMIDLKDGLEPVPLRCLDGSTEPTIATTIFPNMVDGSGDAWLRLYRTSFSSIVGSIGTGVAVGFREGFIDRDNQYIFGVVRLVR